MANAEHLQELHKCVATQDRLRWHGYSQRLIFRNGKSGYSHYEPMVIDLTHADLQKLVFDGVGEELDEQKKRRVVKNLESYKKRLLYAKTHADQFSFSGTDFSHSTLNDTTFNAVFFEHCAATDIIADNIKFVHSTLWDVSLHNSRLRGAKFLYCNFNNPSFCDSDLRNATFVARDDENPPPCILFRNADLTGATFINFNFERTDITRKQLEQCTSIEGCTLPAELQSQRAQIEAAIKRNNETPEERLARHDARRKVLAEKRAAKKTPEPIVTSAFPFMYAEARSNVSEWQNAEATYWPDNMRVNYAEILGAAKPQQPLHSFSGFDAYAAAVDKAFPELAARAMIKRGRIDASMYDEAVKAIADAWVSKKSEPPVLRQPTSIEAENVERERHDEKKWAAKKRKLRFNRDDFNPSR